MKLLLGAAAAAMILAGATQAQEAHSWTVEDDFENITFAVESAIMDAGLVIDHTSHTGEMLERTKEDVGGTRTIFTAADIFSFCSAKVSRAVMEANPENVQFCPYTIFIYERPETPGQITVGFRDYPEGEMDMVEDLLGGIVKEALGVE
ncbi:DUF302 domain-containing protein [Pseudothioclava arenosa]|uniref:DUF302 domain-containing protein n=1 Tax=Pseudothioclava arenosa TaxID=1795308 RepID=A0A2A4CNV5_9RHOB|nr:DUF302 domain-containing protein [Pseudothioclava arenosa]PCD76285.1 DUF302 domain-containing protein [Pseudothioclava arenosa]